jgi:hypothetical protein
MLFVFLYARTDNVNFSTKCEKFGLVDTFSRITGMTGPHQDEELAIVDNASAEVCGGLF